MPNLLVTSFPVRGSWNTEDNQNPLIEDSRLRAVSRPHPWRPPTDVYETETDIIVRVEVAGMRESDFTISIIDRNLLIRGIRQDINERRAYHQMEIPFGEFITEIELSTTVAVELAEANYRDGFLRITLPKSLPKQIKVKG